MDKKGYYSILGVSETASHDEIARQYKKKAMEFHPDRHVNDSDEEKKRAEETFKKIAEAYSVIGDEEKRRQYDSGMDGNFNEGFDPFSMFREHFHGFGDFFGGGHQGNRGSDVVADCVISFEEAFKGVVKDITINKEVECKVCHGTGSADGKNATCQYCHGTGRMRTTTQRGNMTFVQETVCPHCHGVGKTITSPCKHCNGSGVETEKHFERIEIPAGVFDGAQIHISNKGNAPQGGGINGDLIVRIHVTQDPYFVRPDNINVIHYEEIELNDALLGCEKEVKYPDGKTFKIKIHECTKDGESFMYKGKGFKDVQNAYNGYGDYAVVVKYKYPNKLSNKQKQILKEWNS